MSTITQALADAARMRQLGNIPGARILEARACALAPRRLIVLPTPDHAWRLVATLTRGAGTEQ